MDNALAASWALILVAKAIGMFVIPAIITVAAVKVWGIVPHWIPVVFFAAALVGVISSMPPLLIYMDTLSLQQYGTLAIPITVATGISRLLFAVACLGLALKVRKGLTEPQPAAYRR